MNYRLHIYNDAQTTARALAKLILEKAVTKQNESKQLNLAISGGSTPKQLFTLLGDEYETKIPWESVRFFWVDERCVEPTNSESNFGMTYDALLQRAFIPGNNIFRMKGEDIPSNEAERYQKVLLTELPAKNGFPVFDLVLLGIGEDGHTASIFPDGMELLNSEFSVAVSVHPVSRQKRITLTGNTICNADEVVFFVTGESKSTILKQIVKYEDASKNYPAAYIQDSKSNIDLYLDQKAALHLV